MGWRGYISSRGQDGSTVPQRIQNLVLRTYAEKKGLEFLLSAVEYHMEGCFMMLESILEDLDHLDGILFYSTHLLPDIKAQREAIYRRVLTKKRGLYFALEDLCIQVHDDIQPIEDLLMVRHLAGKSPVWNDLMKEN